MSLVFAHSVKFEQGVLPSDVKRPDPEAKNTSSFDDNVKKSWNVSFPTSIIKEDGYDFSHPYDCPRNSHLFFKLPLADTEFDIPVVLYTVSTMFLEPDPYGVSVHTKISARRDGCLPKT